MRNQSNIVVELDRKNEQWHFMECYQKSREREGVKAPINWDYQNGQFLDRGEILENQKMLIREQMGMINHLNEDFFINFNRGIPQRSKWFRFETISVVEKESLPEFFGEKISKTPVHYMHIRNFIIVVYWKNPKIKLTVTAIRRCVGGDVNSIVRVHNFLEHWGIINKNYKITQDAFSSQEIQSTPYPNFTMEKKSKKKNEFLESLKEKSIDLIYSLCHQKRTRCIVCDKLNSIEFWKIKSKQIPTLVCTQCYDQKMYPIVFDDQDFLHEKICDFGEKLPISQKLKILGDLVKFKKIENILGQNQEIEPIKVLYCVYQILLEINQIDREQDESWNSNLEILLVKKFKELKKQVDKCDFEKRQKISQIIANNDVVLEKNLEQFHQLITQDLCQYVSNKDQQLQQNTQELNQLRETIIKQDNNQINDQYNMENNGKILEIFKTHLFLHNSPLSALKTFKKGLNSQKIFFSRFSQVPL